MKGQEKMKSEEQIKRAIEIYEETINTLSKYKGNEEHIRVSTECIKTLKWVLEER